MAQGAESEQMAVQLAELKRLRARPSNSPTLNDSLDWDIADTIGKLQAARPPAARLEAVRATKKELVLRRDKFRK
eukprot:3165106-Prorocentrum_lima.AAC.1